MSASDDLAEVLSGMFAVVAGEVVADSDGSWSDRLKYPDGFADELLQRLRTRGYSIVDSNTELITTIGPHCIVKNNGQRIIWHGIEYERKTPRKPQAILANLMSRVQPGTPIHAIRTMIRTAYAIGWKHANSGRPMDLLPTDPSRVAVMERDELP